MSRNNLEIVLASIPKLVPPLHSRNSLSDARTWKVHRDHRRRRHTSRTGAMERFRAKMAGAIAWRHSDRARTFLVLFSHRYLHRFKHCLEFASVALLDFPALKFSKVGASNAVATGLWPV